LGWATSHTSPIDLDASCIMLRYMMKIDHAWFRDVKSLDGSVLHSGDNRVGGDGVADDEQITVNLYAVNPKVNALFFVVNVFNDDMTFSVIRNAYVRLRNDKSGKELCRYTLSECGSKPALVMCKLYRFSPSLWKFNTIGVSATGHTMDKTLKDIVPFLTKSPPLRMFSVLVQEAKNLPRENIDVLNPYLVVRFDDKTEKTKPLKNTANPNFQQRFDLKGESTVIEINVFSRKLTMGLRKEDKNKQRRLVGRVLIDVPADQQKISIGPKWFDLYGENGRQIPSGQLKIVVSQD